MALTPKEELELLQLEAEAYAAQQQPSGQPQLGVSPEQIKNFSEEQKFKENLAQSEQNIFGEKPSIANVLPALGATALTMAAPEIGFPARVGLAVLGGAGGKGYEQISRMAQNKPIPPTMGGQIGEMAGAGIAMGGAEAIGTGIGKAITYPFARSTAQDIVQGAENLPIAKPQIAIGGDLSRAVQSGIGESPLGIKLLNETKIPENIAVQSVEEKLASELAFKNKFADEVAKYKQSGIEGMGRKQIGEQIQSTFDRVIQGKSKIEKMLYKNIPEGAAASNSSDSYEYIQNLFGRQGVTSAISKDVPKEVLQAAGEETGFTSGKLETKLSTLEPRDFNFFQSVLKDLENPNLTFDDLKRIRTMVGEAGDFESVKAAGLDKTYNGLYGKLTNDMRRSAVEGGFLKEFEKANSFSSDFFKFSRSDVAKAINTRNPENLIDYIVGENTPSRIETVMNNFSEKGRTELKSLALERIFEKSGNSLQGFNKTLNSYSDETLNTLFGKDSNSIKSLRNLSNILVEKGTIKIGVEQPISNISGVEKDALKITNSSTGRKFLDSFKSSNDPEILSTIMNNLNNQTKEVVKSAMFSDIIESSKIGVGKEANKIVAKSLNEQLGKLSEDSIKAIYGNDSKYVLALKDISKLSDETLRGTFLDDINRFRWYHPTGWLVNLKKMYQTTELPTEIFKILKERNVPVSTLSKKTFLLGLPKYQRGGTLAAQIGISSELNKNENQ